MAHFRGCQHGKPPCKARALGPRYSTRPHGPCIEQAIAPSSTDCAKWRLKHGWIYPVSHRSLRCKIDLLLRKSHRDSQKIANTYSISIRSLCRHVTCIQCGVCLAGTRPRQILLRSPRYFAAKCCCEIYDILPSLAQESRYFAPFCSGKTCNFIQFPYNPVQRFIKSQGRFLNTDFHARVPEFFQNPVDPQWIPVIFRWHDLVLGSVSCWTKEIQVSGIDFTQHLDILLRFCRQFFQFFDILPKELPAGSVWA